MTVPEGFSPTPDSDPEFTPFEVRFLTESGKWIWRIGDNPWSEPMVLGKAMVAMQNAVTPIVRPIGQTAPTVKKASFDVKAALDLYEISGGKVQRIASTAKERQEQQIAELMALVNKGE